jgi:hypothetical protein
VSLEYSQNNIKWSYIALYDKAASFSPDIDHHQAKNYIDIGWTVYTQQFLGDMNNIDHINIIRIT